MSHENWKEAPGVGGQRITPKVWGRAPGTGETGGVTGSWEQGKSLKLEKREQERRGDSHLSGLKAGLKCGSPNSS